MAHLERRCLCYGGTEHDGRSRDDAKAVLEWLIAQQHPTPGFIED